MRTFKRSSCYTVFFCTDTPPTEIYTLSLHDALPISDEGDPHGGRLGVVVEERGEDRHAEGRAHPPAGVEDARADSGERGDRKSTRLNSSHSSISYAVFCLKKKKKKQNDKSIQEQE